MTSLPVDNILNAIESYLKSRSLVGESTSNPGLEHKKSFIDALNAYVDWRITAVLEQHKSRELLKILNEIDTDPTLNVNFSVVTEILKLMKEIPSPGIYIFPVVKTEKT